MKKTLSLMVAVAFAYVSGFAVAQTAPSQSLEPSVQATPAASKAGGKVKSKKAKAKSGKRAKAR